MGTRDEQTLPFIVGNAAMNIGMYCDLGVPRVYP